MKKAGKSRRGADGKERKAKEDLLSLV